MTTMLRLIVQRHWRQHQPSLRGLFKECNGRQPYLNEQVCLRAACQYTATDGNFLGRATGSRHAGVACCGQSVVSLQPVLPAMLNTKAEFSCKRPARSASDSSFP